MRGGLCRRLRSYANKVSLEHCLFPSSWYISRLFSDGIVALDATIQNDPKYKKYAQQVEKCLASFESMHEWPDFIAFLKQLLKVLGLW